MTNSIEHGKRVAVPKQQSKGREEWCWVNRRYPRAVYDALIEADEKIARILGNLDISEALRDSGPEGFRAWTANQVAVAEFRAQHILQTPEELLR